MSQEYINAYDDFKPYVDQVLKEPESATFLGKGAESRAWQFTIDNSDYVLKVANKLNWRNRPSNVALVTAEKMSIAALGKGIARLEQMVAASPLDGISVYDYVPGTVMRKFDDDDYDESMALFLPAVEETIIAATEAGIMFDGMNSSGGNTVYESGTGFTFIDYGQNRNNFDVVRNRTYAFRSMGMLGIRLALEMGG